MAHAHKAMNNPDCVVGALGTTAGFLAESFCKQVKANFDQCMFKTATHCLRSAHVGAGACQMAGSHLRTLQQEDDANGCAVVTAVAACFEHLMSVVNEIPPGVLHPNLWLSLHRA